ncbi:class I SAM-dependent methyltransferase [bacterium]|nr:class I SAM-dependent methyltransferase [bacterium]
MHNIVFFDEFHEIDLKPSSALKRYLEMTENSIPDFFPANSLHECYCPGCGINETSSQFMKFGFRYLECISCGTLYVSPRPSEGALIKYFSESKAEHFWRNEFIKMTFEKRNTKILTPLLQWIEQSTSEYLPQAISLADAYTKQPLYLEKLVNAKPFSKRFFLQPFLSQEAFVNHPEINRIMGGMSEWKIENIDVLSLIDGIGFSSDASVLLNTAYNLLSPGGLFFLTTTLSSGFDLQVLWKQSMNIIPPARLNLFSEIGLLQLINETGFECIEFSTPGILDTEIVCKAIQSESLAEFPRFVSYMMKHKSEDTHRLFQEFLQENRLSSYARLLLRKPT